MIKRDKLNKTISLNYRNDDFNIVLITQDSLRHKNFILRIYQEFPAEKIRVLIYKPLSQQKTKLSLFEKTLKIIKSLINFREFLYNKRYLNDFRSSENRIFSQIEKKYLDLKINSIEFNRKDQIVDIFSKMSIDFLISLGGPLIPNEALKLVKGISLNQHAGISPDYKGNYTTFWPLFHRKLSDIGTTIHITATGADSGDILKVKKTNLDITDTPSTIFHKTVMLGTETIITVLKDLLDGKELTYKKQNPLYGKTYLSKEFTNYHKKFIYMDWENNWFKHELTKIKGF